MASKLGATKGSGPNRMKWNGRRWVPSPERAATTSTSKKVTRSRQENRRSTTSKRTASANTTPSTKSTMGRPGVIVGDKSGATKVQRERDASIKRTADVKARAAAKSEAAKDEQKNRLGPKSEDTRKLPPTPKLPARPSAPKAAPKKESSKKLTPMQQWAAAHKGLAKKVKKGQSGYKELKIGRSTKPRNWLEKNYKPGKKK